MGYNALHAMSELNLEQYGISDSVQVPPLPQAKRSFGREALRFVRDDCENLLFDTADVQRKALSDSDGRSASPHQIPYNMERDLDRLSFETAIARFLESGSREDAFDIYYCYCEMFKPFGAGYDSTGLLLELLSEHETNASSLLMKHRDHYSHSVYVFLIGLAMYRNLQAVRTAYNQRYDLSEGPAAACHFLEFWGLTSLFHDIGYPFEIAHQQMKAYVCKLDPSNNDDWGFSPYVSYRNMDQFCMSRVGDLNELYASAVVERLSLGYMDRCSVEPYHAKYELGKELADRAVHQNPREMDYLFMDHAYFSGLMMIKTYLSRHREIDAAEKLPVEVMDACCAIILHNSLFKFTIRSFLHTREPLRLDDGQPLAYLLMLCDELQCWDRASYGQSNRGSVYPFDFDVRFDGGMRWTYFFDDAYEQQARASKAYRDVCADGYTKRSGAVRDGRSKFVDDIDEIVSICDVVPAFEPDVSKPDTSGIIQAQLEPKQKKTGLYLSDSSYLNLYAFALALNGRYAGVSTQEQMKQAFEEDLSLEYKLSNIAQAKGFASQLESIGCFYTDRPVEYAPVTNFASLVKEPGHLHDVDIISRSEHDRWCAEKQAMGWTYGCAHVNAVECDDGSRKNDNVMRERTRKHHDLMPYEQLSSEERDKDTRAMNKMLELIREYDGLTVYRMW